LDKEREKWIARADDYKRKHGTEMVVIFRSGIYENWPVDVFDKCGDENDAVYRTDRAVEPKTDVPRMTVGEYAKSVFERMG